MRNFLDVIFGGHRKEYERCSENYARCMNEITLLSAGLAEAEKENKRLKDLLAKKEHRSKT